MKRHQVIASPFATLVVAMCLSLIGVALLPLLPLKLAPTEQLPTLTVQFGMRGATSRVVEQNATSRLEAVLARIDGVRNISSSSYNGSGRVVVRLHENADIDNARFQASTFIRQVYPTLPAGVSYPQISVRHTDEQSVRPFLNYSINAPCSSAEIYERVDAVFKTAFADIADLAGVTVSGAERMEWQLRYNASQVAQMGISEQQIARAIRENNYSAYVGDYVLRVADCDSLQLSKITVLSADSVAIPLNRLVTMQRSEANPSRYFRINGLNSIYLSLTAHEKANQIALKEQVEKRINELRENLPVGFEMHKMYDATEYISSELDKIYYRSGLTVLILLLFVFFTTFSWRYVVVVTISLIFNIAIALIAYYALDVQLHLYSLAAITISLNLIIDNIIIMTNHFKREQNLRAILPVLAATLTTIGALSVVFFLDDSMRLNLVDFAVVMIVNLAISIVIAMTVVPALLMLQKQDETNNSVRRRRIRFVAAFNRFYARYITFASRHRVIATVVVVLLFGLPVFMMPGELNEDNPIAPAYNATFGSELYQKQLKPIVDIALGGTLRLFVDKVYSSSYRSGSGEVQLNVNATLPNGTTLEQMNTLVKRMESYLTTFPQIRQFQTNVQARRASITIMFTPEAAHSAFPYQLKSDIISKAIQLGGGSWSVYGLPDQGFSNDVRENNGSYSIQLNGYNYDELYVWTDSLKQHLLSFMRIKEVNVSSNFSYWKDDYTEFRLSPDIEKIAKFGITPYQVFSALQYIFNTNRNCGQVWVDDKPEAVTLRAAEADGYDVWMLNNLPINVGKRCFKVSDLCEITKEPSPHTIEKENQQYRLCVQYDYVGSSKSGNRVQNEAVDKYAQMLPAGYSIEGKDNGFRWRSKDNSIYWLLGLVIAIIVFVTAILFNSLKSAFVVLALIPMAFIGLFLTFYLFGFNFDYGGLAAMVLLCGITINAGIYILNEYYVVRKSRPGQPLLRSYLKAYNTKIAAIMLTVLSTILGFVPFIVGSEHEGFWFPLSVGVIGGLLLSILGVVFLLPVYCCKAEKK